MQSEVAISGIPTLPLFTWPGHKKAWTEVVSVHQGASNRQHLQEGEEETPSFDFFPLCVCLYNMCAPCTLGVQKTA